MEIIPIHALRDEEQASAMSQCVKILNCEWPRSETIRLRGLQSSSDQLPANLVLVTRVRDEIKVVGHSRISKIPADPSQVFVESVVIHPQLRGKGLGKILMLKTEEYCVNQGFTTSFLTTHDQQIFYSRCGYKFSEAVCAFGGSSTLNIGNFIKSPPTKKPSLTIPSPSTSPQSGPPPPPPPGPPPPPLTNPKPNSYVHSEPSQEMKDKCAAAYTEPKLSENFPQLDDLPDVDMSLWKEKNNEDSGEKHFMKKILL